MLSPIDIVLVIVDSYFNDIDGQIVPDKEKITDEIVRLKEKYQGKRRRRTFLRLIPYMKLWNTLMEVI